MTSEGAEHELVEDVKLEVVKRLAKSITSLEWRMAALERAEAKMIIAEGEAVMKEEEVEKANDELVRWTRCESPIPPKVMMSRLRLMAVWVAFVVWSASMVVTLWFLVWGVAK